MDEFFWGVVVGALICLLIFTPTTGCHGTHKQGQIDAINGVIKYKLVMHPDKTTSWELKDKK